MRRCLVIQSSYAEFLGSFERLLEDRHIGFNYCRPFLGEHVPVTALQHDALWVLGGPDRLNDPQAAPHHAAIGRLIGVFRRARRPVIGLGSGALLVALQAGGRVESAADEHACFVQARTTARGADDPVAAAADGRQVLLMHAGAVRLPAGVEPLLTTPAGDWLLARPDPTSYAMLPRFEMKPGMLEDMAMEEGRDMPEHIGGLIEEARARWDATEALARRLVAALIVELNLMHEHAKPAVIPVRVVKP